MNEHAELARLARERVNEEFKIVSHGEVGEPSNGALLLRMAEAIEANVPFVVNSREELLDMHARGLGGIPLLTAGGALGFVTNIALEPMDDDFPATVLVPKGTALQNEDIEAAIRQVDASPAVTWTGKGGAREVLRFALSPEAHDV